MLKINVYTVFEYYSRYFCCIFTLSQFTYVDSEISISKDLCASTIICNEESKLPKTCIGTVYNQMLALLYCMAVHHGPLTQNWTENCMAPTLACWDRLLNFSWRDRLTNERLFWAKYQTISMNAEPESQDNPGELKLRFLMKLFCGNPHKEEPGEGQQGKPYIS